jgi:hypothetical protein
MRLPAWLVRLYPPAWRSRYGEEFEALLEESLRSPLDVVDVILGALDARFFLFNKIDWRTFIMVNKLRTTILIVFSAYIAFIMGGIGLVGVVDDSPVADLMKTGTAKGLLISWNTVEAASAIALFTVIVGGMPLAAALFRRAFKSRRIMNWLLVPLFSSLVFALYCFFWFSISKGWIHIPGVLQYVSEFNFPLGNKLILGGYILVLIIGASVNTLAIWKAITSVEQDAPDLPHLYRFSFYMAVILSIAMLVMLIGTLIFGWLAHAALPDWFTSNQGLLLTNTTFSYGVTVAVMAVSTAAAIFGLLRGRASLQAGREHPAG